MFIIKCLAKFWKWLLLVIIVPLLWHIVPRVADYYKEKNIEREKVFNSVRGDIVNALRPFAYNVHNLVFDWKLDVSFRDNVIDKIRGAGRDIPDQAKCLESIVHGLVRISDQLKLTGGFRLEDYNCKNISGCDCKTDTANRNSDNWPEYDKQIVFTMNNKNVASGSTVTYIRQDCEVRDFYNQLKMGTDKSKCESANAIIEKIKSISNDAINEISK